MRLIVILLGAAFASYVIYHQWKRPGDVQAAFVPAIGFIVVLLILAVTWVLG